MAKVELARAYRLRAESKKKFKNLWLKLEGDENDDDDDD